jgi:hypothetical protein
MLRRTAAICRPVAAAMLQYARQIGADLTGVVQKVSNLILSIDIHLRDVNTGHARQY